MKRMNSGRPRIQAPNASDLQRKLPPITPDRRRQGLEAVAQARRRHAEILALRGGVPYSNSGNLLNEWRDEQSRQSEPVSGDDDGREGMATRDVSSAPFVPLRLTSEEQQRTLRIVNELKQMHAEMLARRGGKPFPNSWELINEEREKRTRQLEQVSGRGDDEEHAS